jgi:hypothetical protein
MQVVVHYALHTDTHGTIEDRVMLMIFCCLLVLWDEVGLTFVAMVAMHDPPRRYRLYNRYTQPRLRQSRWAGIN